MGTSSGQSTVRCSRCGKSWPHTATACPEDGTLLEIARASGPAVHASLEVGADLATRDTGLAIDAPPARTLGSNVPGPAAPVRFDAAGAELARGTRVGDYEIEGKIGEGAMGAVYRAVHPAIGKRVAVKVMNPRLGADAGAIERFTREARSVAAIRHPGIVDVFGFGALDDGRAYLVMEWLDGVSLATRLDQGTLPPDEALEILDQIARALEAAHDKGIIHRDLKPDNIFLQHVARERPIVKLLDFGLVKLAFEERLDSKTQTGQLLGTPVYMSPEQCRGKGVDHRTDIYAVGCIAYEMICGRVPFVADNIAELIAAHLGEVPPLPRSLRPDIPPALDACMFAMLAKEPARRPTLEQARQAILDVRRSSAPGPWPSSLAGPWATPVPGTWPPPAPPAIPSMLSTSTAPDERAARRARRTVAAAIAVSFAVVGAVVVLAMTKDRGRERSEPERRAGTTMTAAPSPVVVAPRAETIDAPSPLPPAAPPPPVTSAAQPPVADTRVGSPGSEKRVKKATRPVVERSGVEEPVAVAEAPARQGALSLRATPPCDIYIDGKATGLRTPQREIKLDAGHHVVTLVHDELAIKDTFHVEIKPGNVEHRVKDFSDRLDEQKPDVNKQTINPFDKKQAR